MKQFVLFTLFSVALANGYGQNIAINTTGSVAASAAALDVDVANKGILIPRVALTGTTTFSPVTGAAITSLMVYNTATAGVAPNNVTPGFYYWNGTSWSKFVPSNETAVAGDIKYGFQAADHTGWVKLDGRPISSLTTTQQAVAASLGFSGNLPNASGRVLKTQGAINTVGGANTVVIAQANLPNYNMTATTSTNGNHAHSGTTSTNGDHSHGNNAPGGPGNLGLPLASNIGQFNTISGNAQNPAGLFIDPSMDGELNVYSLPAGLAIYNNGNHSHNFGTSTDGNHNHTVTVNSAGGGATLNVENAFLSVNTFIFLGN